MKESPKAPDINAKPCVTYLENSEDAGDPAITEENPDECKEEIQQEIEGKVEAKVNYFLIASR